MQARIGTMACALVAASFATGCRSHPAAAAQAPVPRGAAPAEGEPAAPDFGPFPTTSDAAFDLVRRETVRPVAQAHDLTADAILGAIAARPGELAGGSAAIARRLQAFLDRAPGDAYLLVGTWHDAPGQIDAFRRLVGPGGLRGLDVVAVEMFRADGAWSGAPTDPQRGDGAAINAYVTHGDADAFASLARAHRDVDYAAWKLDYEATVLDLLVEARAARLRFRGCDMPIALQERSGASPGPLRHRLREIHCVRSLPPPPRETPRRAALLWGDAHLAPDGLQRFLPASAAVLALHLVGARLTPGALETALAKDLAVTAPVLVPLGADEAALVLPDAVLGAQVDRVLTRAEPGAPFAPGVFMSGRGDGSVVVGDRSTVVGERRASIAVPEGEHTYVYASGAKRTVGVLRLDAGHRVELAFEGRSVSYVDSAPP
jgi:hypothetical protein